MSCFPQSGTGRFKALFWQAGLLLNAGKDWPYCVLGPRKTTPVTNPTAPEQAWLLSRNFCGRQWRGATAKILVD